MGEAFTASDTPVISDDNLEPGRHYYMVRVVHEQTPHQKSVILPRIPGLALCRDAWNGSIQVAPDSGAPPGPFEIEHELGGAVAWSTPTWVHTK